MYPNLYDEVRHRQATLLREAEQERLIKAVLGGAKKTRHFYHLLAYHLGHQLELWGCKLKHFGAVARMSHQES